MYICIIVLNKGALFILRPRRSGMTLSANRIEDLIWASDHATKVFERDWEICRKHLIMQPKREREMKSTMEGMSWGQGLTRKPKRGISRKPGIGTNPNIGTNTLSYRFWNCYHLFLVRENNPKPFPSPHFFLRAPPSKAWPDTQSQLSLHSPWVRCLLTGKS